MPTANSTRRKDAQRPATPRWMRLILLILLAGILAFLLVTWLNLPWRPDVTRLPPDSGFYAYIGKAILHGQVLYRDAWDDKPPLGYYLNAAGQAIFGQTTWGVWWSSIVWITACALLLFFILRALFGWISAALASLIFLALLMNPQLFQGGNLMEVYALLPQVAILGAAWLYFSRSRNSWLSVGVGGLTAAAFLIKQPTIALGCSAILLMAVSAIKERKFERTFLLVSGFIVGFAFVIYTISLYWMQVGALRQLLDGLFLQGLSFIGGPQSSFLRNLAIALVKALPALILGNFFLIALLTGAIFILEKLYQARRSPGASHALSPLEWTWLVAFIALPIEVFAASLGGKYYGHYFITMLPAVVTTITYPIWSAISLWKIKPQSWAARLCYGLFSVLAAASLLWGGVSLRMDAPSSMYTKNLNALFSGRDQLNDLEQYIVQTTSPTDTLLVWHIHLGINFVTGRSAPSRFLYPENLFIPASPDNTKLSEFIDDLENHPPELIVVQKVSSLGLPFVDRPLDDLCVSGCTPDFTHAIAVPEIRQQWLRLQEYFQANYAPDKEIYDWVIYRRLH